MTVREYLDDHDHIWMWGLDGSMMPTYYSKELIYAYWDSILDAQIELRDVVYEDVAYMNWKK